MGPAPPHPGIPASACWRPDLPDLRQGIQESPLLISPKLALKAGMPGWVFAGSIRVRGGLDLLMACTDTSGPGAAWAVPASRPEKSHPGVTAVACSGNSLSYPEPASDKAQADAAMGIGGFAQVVADKGGQC